MSTTGEHCAACGKPLQDWHPDEDFCSESCQTNWTRNYWGIPSFAEEIRNGSMSVYRFG